MIVPFGLVPATGDFVARSKTGDRRPINRARQFTVATPNDD